MEGIIRNSSLPLLGETKKITGFLKISIAIIALRIKKALTATFLVSILYFQINQEEI